MKTFDELNQYVAEKAKSYLSETDTQIEKFPQSIVDFVVEYAIECCHFPNWYTEERKVGVLAQYKTSLAMACNDVFSKTGAEGQVGHNENGTSRTYETSWITPRLLCGLPNFANVIG